MIFLVFSLAILYLSFDLTYGIGDDLPTKCLVGQPLLYQNATLMKNWKQPKPYKVCLDNEPGACPPSTRWRHVVKDYVDEINGALAVIRNSIFQQYNVSSNEGDLLWGLLDLVMAQAHARLQEPYKSEIQGISDATNITVGDLTLYNLFYEISAACTSIVAKDKNGVTYHARNLDFGQGFGWNSTDQQWELSDYLRKLNINVDFTDKNGNTMFKGVAMAGHVGIFTGIKKNGFSITINERDDGGSFMSLMNFLQKGYQNETINGKSYTQNFVCYAIRDALQNQNNYSDAITYLSNVPLYEGGYFIVGGCGGQGAIVTRNATTLLMNQAMTNISKTDLSNNTLGKEDWFVLQTNYDWNVPDDTDDERTIPGRKCMMNLGQDNVNFAGIFQVLNSRPNLNKGTVHTSLMNLNDGTMETYVQACPCPDTNNNNNNTNNNNGGGGSGGSTSVFLNTSILSLCVVLFVFMRK